MAVGISVTKEALDRAAGKSVLQLHSVFETIEKVKSYLDGRSDADLISSFGYTQDEVTLLKTSFTALDKLRRIAGGQATQADADNFFFWADQLTGLTNP